MAITVIDRFELPEGAAQIYWPRPLSEESMAELLDWLDLVRRKISRHVIPSPKAGAQPAPSALPATEKTKKHSGRPADD